MNKSKYNTVMLIDDNEIDNLINRKMLERSIAEHFYIHTTATSALEFLRNFESRETAKDILPDLIFLDVDMPLLDGFDFLNEFDNFTETIRNHCKVVMLTSSNNPADLKRSKKYPVVKLFLNKPLTLDAIKKIDF